MRFAQVEAEHDMLERFRAAVASALPPGFLFTARAGAFRLELRLRLASPGGRLLSLGRDIENFRSELRLSRLPPEELLLSHVNRMLSALIRALP